MTLETRCWHLHAQLGPLEACADYEPLGWGVKTGSSRALVQGRGREKRRLHVTVLSRQGWRREGFRCQHQSKERQAEVYDGARGRVPRTDMPGIRTLVRGYLRHSAVILRSVLCGLWDAWA